MNSQKAITETEQNWFPYVHSFFATPFTLILLVQLLRYGQDMNSQLLKVPFPRTCFLLPVSPATFPPSYSEERLLPSCACLVWNHWLSHTSCQMYSAELYPRSVSVLPESDECLKLCRIGLSRVTFFGWLRNLLDEFSEPVINGQNKHLDQRCVQRLH